MKIIIDNSNLVVGGGIQVGSSFLNDLRKIKNKNEYHVIQSLYSKENIDKELFPSNFVFYDLNEKAIKSIRERIKAVKIIEQSVKPDVIFVTFGPSYHKSICPKIVGFAIPYIVYPDSPYFDNISLGEKLKLKMLSFIKIKSFNRNSNDLIFETENAQNIYKTKAPYGIKLHTVNNTLNEIFYEKERWENLNCMIPETINILCLTANYPHKNVKIIPKVIDVLKSKFNFHKFNFIITLEEDHLMFDNKYKENITYIGKVPMKEIPNLYLKSNMLFMPTLLEVFSTTYLEAMYMKIPIIASDMPFSRDICGEAALYCKATNPEEYANAIYQVVTDSAIKDQLVANGTVNMKRFGTSMNRTQSYLNIIETYL